MIKLNQHADVQIMVAALLSEAMVQVYEHTLRFVT